MKTNADLNLSENPTLADFHNYVKDIYEIRGFSDDVLKNSLMLGEEVGELFKAIRKAEGVKVDNENSKFGNIEEELADMFIYILAIANKYGINLEEVFRAKEEVNKKRVWG